MHAKRSSQLFVFCSNELQTFEFARAQSHSISIITYQYVNCICKKCMSMRDVLPNHLPYGCRHPGYRGVALLCAHDMNIVRRFLFHLHYGCRHSGYRGVAFLCAHDMKIVLRFLCCVSAENTFYHLHGVPAHGIFLWWWALRLWFFWLCHRASASIYVWYVCASCGCGVDSYCGLC